MAVQTGHQLVFEPSWAVIEYELAGSLYTGMKQFWNDIKASGAKDFINPTPEVGSISYHIESMYFYYLRNGAFYACSSALLAHVKAGKLRAGHRLCVPCCSGQKDCKKRSSRGLCNASCSRSHQLSWHCANCCWSFPMKIVRPNLSGPSIDSSKAAGGRTKSRGDLHCPESLKSELTFKILSMTSQAHIELAPDSCRCVRCSTWGPLALQ